MPKRFDVTAIIPARGGSVRLPRKNIIPLNGKPLIAYTLEAWQASSYYTRPIVSTDDDEIAQIAAHYGAEIVKRPASLSQGDLLSPVPIIQHVIDYLAKYQQRRAHWILFLQPTSPLRTAKDIDDCLDLMSLNTYDSLTTVCEGKENGAVYVTHADLVARGRFYGDKLFEFIMPPKRSIDIDTYEDLEKAEAILNDNSRELHELARPERGEGNDTRRKRGRPKRSI